MLNVNHLRVFYSVAHNLSFSKAAEELYTSQSSVSIQIKKLEESLGIKLFEQLGKKIFLTEAGTILFTYSQKAFGLIDEAMGAINEIKGYSRGRLLIGASTTPGIYLFPKLIGKFKQNYPGVEPKLQIANSQSVAEMVSKNLLDFGVIGEEFTYPSELYVEPWIKDELHLILPRSHPLAQNKVVKLEDLHTLEFVLREPGSSTRSIVENILSKYGFTANITMELNNTEAVKQAVSAGLGVSIVSKFSVIGNPDIVSRPISELNFYRVLNIIFHREKIFSPSTNKFLKFLEDMRTSLEAEDVIKHLKNKD